MYQMAGLYNQSIVLPHLTFEDWRGGYNFYVFDLTSDMSGTSLLDNYILKPSKTGVLRVALKFDNPLEEPLIMLVMSSSYSKLTIDDQSRVSMDYIT